MMGLPDNGNGRYSKAISYKDWYVFNNRQRAHYNQIEQLPLVLTLLLINGFYLPLTTVILGACYFVARIAYVVGYVTGGPSARLPGALCARLIELGLIGIGIYSVVEAFRA